MSYTISFECPPDNMEVRFHSVRNDIGCLEISTKDGGSNYKYVSSAEAEAFIRKHS